MLRKTISLVALSVSLAATSLSQTITMVHEGIASGDLGGVPFLLSPFTITCTGDISTRQSSPTSPGFWINHASATIEISGVGAVTLISPTRTFVNNSVAIFGFSRAIPPTNGGDLFNGPIDVAAATWDMLSPVGPLNGTGTTVQWGISNDPVDTTGGVLMIDNNGGLACVFTAVIGDGSIGTPYCPAAPNSTGQASSLTAVGSSVASQNDLTLTADILPANSFGYFLASQLQGLVMNPAGSAGNLCLGGAIGRYVGAGQIQNSGSAGAINLTLDLTMTPTPTGLVSIQAGDTWNFQAWHRDVIQGQATSNFSTGLEVEFQ